jgi:hypothetical protein
MVRSENCRLSKALVRAISPPSLYAQRKVDRAHPKQQGEVIERYRSICIKISIHVLRPGRPDCIPRRFGHHSHAGQLPGDQYSGGVGDLAVHGPKRAGDGAAGHDVQSVLDELEHWWHQEHRGADPTLPSGPAKIGDTQYTLRTNATPTTFADLNNTPIKHTDGPTVFLKDVGLRSCGAALEAFIFARIALQRNSVDNSVVIFTYRSHLLVVHAPLRPWVGTAAGEFGPSPKKLLSPMAKDVTL